MATVSDGTNQGRQGASPARQSPAPARQGRAEAGLDPTEQQGQTPPDIFGFSQSYSTGAAGSAGGTRGGDGDVTTQAGQLEEGLSGVHGDEITHTGAPGGEGAHNSNGGPDTVHYTDPWGILGGVNRDVTVSAHIDGIGDWTQANDMGYGAGPTLPALEGNRPLSTGAGSGAVRGAPHPDAMDGGSQPRPAGNPNAGH